MKAGLSTFRRRSFVPGVALIASLLLFTGQTFSCCRLNESLSETFHRLLPFHHHDSEEDVTPNHEADESETHTCHGHGEKIAVCETDATYAAEGDCISKKSLAEKPMVKGDGAQVQFTKPILCVIQDNAAITSFRADHPRPQNKSSPPLYLTTLRILV